MPVTLYGGKVKREEMNKLSLTLYLLTMFFIDCVNAVEINHVFHKPKMFEPDNGQTVQVHFTLTKQADITLNIYDDRDLLIQQVFKGSVPAGDQYLEWNGKDKAGVVVPAEAYRYTLQLRSSNNKPIEYDVSDFTGGKKITIKNIKWNSDDKQFEYTLKQPARVMIRVGLKEHGPLLANILNWVPRIEGQHVEKWDGKDASNILDLTKHPKLEIDMQAYTLSENTILVGANPDKVKFVNNTWKQQRRVKKQKKRKNMVAAQQQKPDTRGDYLARLVLPDNLLKNKDNVPIVSGQLRVQLTVDDVNRGVALNRRAEPVFFVDGQFAFENEVGFLPMTWILDTSRLNEGEHYLTANIRGYEGNFGLATIKIYVQKR